MGLFGSIIKLDTNTEYICPKRNKASHHLVLKPAIALLSAECRALELDTCLVQVLGQMWAGLDFPLRVQAAPLFVAPYVELRQVAEL